MADILLNTKKHVEALLTKELDPNYLYHNLRHTQRVVKSTKELSKACALSDKEVEVLEIAAWFHDTGYTIETKNHEKNSCIMAAEFLEKNGYDPELTSKVSQYIMATEKNAVPTSLEEKIIRDADASHFAQKSYLETSELLREELRLLNIADYTYKDWVDINIKMLGNQHRYYTDCAKELGKKKRMITLTNLSKKKNR
ncbi:HD domain-containing protein [Maribacter litopenaei]|uniref:HD domain-containing protein n=1 Tax=Maribacter litopenaei TaxID=2976127 RepID=UPI00308420D1